MISMVRIRELDLDADFSLRGDTLQKAINEDRRNGLIPFYVSSADVTPHTSRDVVLRHCRVSLLEMRAVLFNELDWRVLCMFRCAPR